MFGSAVSDSELLLWCLGIVPVILGEVTYVWPVRSYSKDCAGNNILRSTIPYLGVLSPSLRASLLVFTAFASASTLGDQTTINKTCAVAAPPEFISLLPELIVLDGHSANSHRCLAFASNHRRGAAHPANRARSESVAETNEHRQSVTLPMAGLD